MSLQFLNYSTTQTMQRITPHLLPFSDYNCQVTGGPGPGSGIGDWDWGLELGMGNGYGKWEWEMESTPTPSPRR